MTTEAPKAGDASAETHRIPVEGEEVLEGHTTALTPFEGDFMDVTVQVAESLEKYGKAIDAILNFIIKRTYTGDWVSHDKESTPMEDRTVNMIGAAAERIARDLGIQETNRTQPKKIMNQDYAGHYRYECEGDFEFRGRKIHAIGIADTRNPFYSMAYGKPKDPKEIREEYINRDAWRDCTKQAIKGLFGLRKIPIMKLKELGYDITKVKFVNFKSGAESSTTKSPESTKAPTETKETLTATIKVREMNTRKWGDTPIVDVTTVKGEKYSWWGKKAEDADIKVLALACREESEIGIEYQVKGAYKNITGLVQKAS